MSVGERKILAIIIQYKLWELLQDLKKIYKNECVH